MHRLLARTAIALAVVMVALVALQLVQWQTDTDSTESPEPPKSSALDDVQRAKATLARLPVKGRAPKTGYTRRQFGTGWLTVAGCDMRNRTLAKDLSNVVYRLGTHDCVVERGTLHDPYTGATMPFVRGNTTSTLVQIDHRFSLLLAWEQGAQQWTPEQRVAFANDPANLVAVEGKVNQAKGASGPGSWLPPNKSYRCSFVIAWLDVADGYGLSINSGDHQAASHVLASC